MSADGTEQSGAARALLAGEARRHCANERTGEARQRPGRLCRPVEHFRNLLIPGFQRRFKDAEVSEMEAASLAEQSASVGRTR